jgi:hypothetical protein
VAKAQRGKGDKETLARCFERERVAEGRVRAAGSALIFVSARGRESSAFTGRDFLGRFDLV